MIQLRPTPARLLLASLLASALVAGPVAAQEPGGGTESGQPASGEASPPAEPGPSDPAPAGEAAPGADLPALPLGTTASARASREADAIFTYQAEVAGVLTVVVRAKTDTDMVILVTDADGQTLPNGRADADLDGLKGAEQLAVTIPYPGSYRVRAVVRSFGETELLIGGGWVPVPALATEPDPDGRPSSARALEVNTSIEDAIDSATGDRWDWYAVTAAQPGTLTVVTRAPEGDLVLETYTAESYFEPTERSDQDMGKVRGNESITVQAEAGTTYYFRVLSIATGSGRIPYKITAGLIPE